MWIALNDCSEGVTFTITYGLADADAARTTLMGQAVEEALGDYLLFMNCGDRFYSSHVLQDIADGIGREHGAVYYGKCFDRPTGQVRAYPKTITRMTCYRTMICHQAMVYRADVLRQHPYDCSYRIIADRELLWYLV